MLRCWIRGTASALPGVAHDTRSLARAAMPDRDPEVVVARTGIDTRYWAHKDQSTAEIGADVLQRACDSAGIAPRDLRRVILVTSTGGDFLIPATVNAILDRLGLADTCDGFDLNNACMGFLSALDISARSVATGLSPCAVVVVETLSKHIAPEVSRPYVVLGDAAACLIVDQPPAEQSGGVLGSHFGNNGSLLGTVFLDHAGLTGKTERIEFRKNNKEITGIALSGLRRSAAAVFEQSGLTWDDVDWVVPHQPNGSMLRKIIAEFDLPEEKVFPVVSGIGSVGAASIAYGLDALRAQRDVRPGQRLLFVGVGAGLAYGAILYQVPG